MGSEECINDCGGKSGFVLWVIGTTAGIGALAWAIYHIPLALQLLFR